MAKIITPLTDIKISNTKAREKDYKLFDGGGLYLLIKKNGVKSWRIKYKKPDGKESIMVFGNYPLISLREARCKREELKGQLSHNLDPQSEKAKKKVRKDSKDTFGYIAIEWINHIATNKNWSITYKERVLKTIEKYLFPKLKDKQINIITTRELILVQQHVIDAGVTDVSRRTKEYLISIMRYALYKGLIDVNPALDLQGLIIETKTKHRATLNHKELQQFYLKISNYSGHIVTRYALLVNLHLFLRASELAYARWTEIDFDNKLWVIPATRELAETKYSDRGAKMKVEQLVPLSKQVIILLKELKQHTGLSPFIFSVDNKKPITYSTPLTALRYLGYDKEQISFHGFRSMACSALIESGLFSVDAIERQMSHMERNGVRAAYIHKAKHLQERIALMQWWSDYITYVAANGYIAPYDFKGNTYA